MILRLFYIFIIGLTLYLGYQFYGLYSARQSLVNVPAEYAYGAESYDLTVVEFLDYTCPYCQQMHPVIMEAITLDSNVRYVPRPIMSRNADGTSAAYIYYAAALQGAAARAHGYLIENNSNLTKERLPEIVKALEIDEKQFMEDLNSQKVHNQVQANNKQFAKLGGLATPTFFIGPDIMYVAKDSMPTASDFMKVFTEARGLANQ